jgi:hypothetical protein
MILVYSEMRNLIYLPIALLILLIGGSGTAAQTVLKGNVLRRAAEIFELQNLRKDEPQN